MTGNIGDSTTVPVIFFFTLAPTELVEKNPERKEREEKKKIAQVANYAEQAYLARPVMDMSTKVSSTSIPPLATMLDTLYNGRSVQHTWGGVLLVMNPESMAKLLGLLGIMGAGNYFLSVYLLISLSFT
jgi:hypothetical protein